MAEIHLDEWRTSLGGALKWFPVEFPPTTGGANGGDTPHQDGPLTLFRNGELAIGNTLYERDSAIHPQNGERLAALLERDAWSSIVRIQTGSECRWYNFGFIEHGGVIEKEDRVWDRHRRKYFYDCWFNEPLRLYDDGSIGVGFPPNVVIYEPGDPIRNHRVINDMTASGDNDDGSPSFVLARQTGSTIVEVEDIDHVSSPSYFLYNQKPKQWVEMIRWWSRGMLVSGAKQDRYSGEQPPTEFSDFIRDGRVCRASDDSGPITRFTDKDRARYLR